MKKHVIWLTLLILTGCQTTPKQPPSAWQKQVVYQCKEQAIAVVYLGQQHGPEYVRLNINNQPTELPRLIAASGIRYGDDHYVWWSKGKEGFLQQDGNTILHQCVEQPASGS